MTQDTTMDGYNRFHIEERNQYPQEAGPQYRIRTTASTGPVLNVRCEKETLGEAIAAIRERIQAQLTSALAQAEGWKRQLAEVDNAYLVPHTPGVRLRHQRADISDRLRRFRETGKSGFHRYPGFDLTTGYRDMPGLVVVSLPEYDPVSHTFLAGDIQLLEQMLVEAGFPGPFSSWNGAGCASVSIRIPANQVFRKEEPALAEG